MQDPYPATFQRRHHNVTSPVPPFYTRNNNLSNKADKTSLSSYALKNDLWPQNSGTKITANTDMHTITTTGHYYCQGNNIAATLKNCPCTVAFTLTVYRGAGGSTDGMYIIQEYTTYLGDARIIQVYNEDSKNWTVHRISFSS